MRFKDTNYILGTKYRVTARKCLEFNYTSTNGYNITSILSDIKEFEHPKPAGLTCWQKGETID